MTAREVWITGIGLLSSLGEGTDAHWERLNAEPPRPEVDSASQAPFVFHPLAPVTLDRQIPKKGDQRQMEPWQRTGVYAAGLALETAGIAKNADLLDRTHMIVAAGGGERDLAVDGDVVAGLLARSPEEAGPYLNERLSGDLRPTLFLAQLSNLLAGNISIVHGVTGSSRTFMGEEACGADAVSTAVSRLKARQGDVFLVGGSANAARPDVLLLYALGKAVLKGDFAPVWDRAASGGGFTYGSLGAFLVLEAREHAEARGAKPFARLSDVASERARRGVPGEATESALGLWDRIKPRVDGGALGVISGATGAEPATSEERQFLERIGNPPVRATGSMIGHSLEAQFPANIALAALALSRGGFYPPFDETGVERDAPGPVRQIAVTGFGHWRGEALALVEAV